jgi:hypothetical protein
MGNSEAFHRADGAGNRQNETRKKSKGKIPVPHRRDAKNAEKNGTRINTETTDLTTRSPSTRSGSLETQSTQRTARSLRWADHQPVKQDSLFLGLLVPPSFHCIRNVHSPNRGERASREIINTLEGLSRRSILRPPVADYGRTGWRASPSERGKCNLRLH